MTSVTQNFLRGSTSPRPRFVCSDGFGFSVQVGEFEYCAPRDEQGPWSHVELGYPSRLDGLLIKYQVPLTILGAVYGWVPIEEVDILIAAHEAAHKMDMGDNHVSVMVDSLRSEGVVTTPHDDINNWTNEERVALVNLLK